MKKKYLFIIFIGFLFLFIMSSCDVQLPEQEPFYLRYHEWGGFAGISEKLEIFDNGDIIYKDGEYSFKTHIDETNLSDIYRAIISNNFFELKNEYNFYFCTDDFYYNITYISSSDSQSVTANSSALQFAIGTWKRHFLNIAQAILDYKSTIDMDVDSGYVTILRDYSLAIWPYPDDLNLSEYCDSEVVVDNNIYNFVRNKEIYSDNCLYFENDTIYYVDTRRLNTLHIYYRGSAIQWPFEPPLSQVTDTGIGLYESDYHWLRDHLDNTYLSVYFYDTNTGDNAYAYQLWLRQGNLFEKIK